MVFVVCSLLQYSVAQTTGVASIPEDKSNFHIFMLMGQSNMEGGSSAEGGMDTEISSRILKLNKSGFWEVAKDPITNNKDVAVGPGFEFAKKLVAENPDITVGLIPMAVGGTKISFWSKPSDMNYYCVSNANWARQFGVLKGILWHQGEHDSFNVFDAQSYENDLKILIDQMRIDLQDAYLPFMIGGLTESQYELSKAPYRRDVGAALKTVGSVFPQCAYVSSLNVPFIEEDQIHFTSGGQREMGRRYANAYLTITGFLTEKGKIWLDESVTEEVDGWKFSPELGAYYDESFPIIKHKQLGWLKVSIDSANVIHLDSPFIGKYRVKKDDGFDHAIYIQSEDITDPDNPVLGVAIYVDLMREPGNSYTFYDHAVDAFIDRLPGMTIIEDTWDLNSMVEAEFRQAQWAEQYLRNEIVADDYYWSQMRWFVDDVVYHRNYTNDIGWEGYHYSNDNETGNLRAFWMDKFLERLYKIDIFVGQAQDEYQNATNVLLNQ